jgi:hypothetical protein
MKSKHCSFKVKDVVIDNVTGKIGIITKITSDIYPIEVKFRDDAKVIRSVGDTCIVLCYTLSGKYFLPSYIETNRRIIKVECAKNGECICEQIYTTPIEQIKATQESYSCVNFHGKPIKEG